MDIAFVILHYMTDEDTISCINSIVGKVDTDDYMIIVVDNASHNGSVERIREATLNDPHVMLKENQTNLGFARGLNSGIEEARKENARFVACINNDTLLISNNIVATLEHKYKENSPAIIGPMIVSGDNICDINPIRNNFRSLEEADRVIKKDQMKFRLSQFHLIPLYNSFVKFKNRNKKHVVRHEFLTDKIDYQLHGCFLIFTPSYFTKFDGFDPRTFLYGEESILYLHTLKNGLHTLYTPEIVIYHKEDSSTHKALPNSNDRVRITCKSAVESVSLYKEIYREYEKKEKAGQI